MVCSMEPQLAFLMGLSMVVKLVKVMVVMKAIRMVVLRVHSMADV